MSTKEMRQNINQLLGKVEDERFLRSVLSMVMAYSSEATELTDEQKSELDARIENRLNDDNPGRPWRESIKSIRAGL
jgi:hypothetical protein